jgi:hypothetical protein
MNSIANTDVEKEVIILWSTCMESFLENIELRRLLATIHSFEFPDGSIVFDDADDIFRFRKELKNLWHKRALTSFFQDVDRNVYETLPYWGGTGRCFYEPVNYRLRLGGEDGLHISGSLKAYMTDFELKFLNTGTIDNQGVWCNTVDGVTDKILGIFETAISTWAGSVKDNGINNEGSCSIISSPCITNDRWIYFSLDNSRCGPFTIDWMIVSLLNSLMHKHPINYISFYHMDYENMGIAMGR